MALAAFIFFFERGSLSTGEVAMREGRVLPRFVRDRVSRIEVSQGDRQLVLERKPDPELTDQLGIWTLQEPVTGPADDTAVNALLGELEWMNARRRLENLSADDLASFGLKSPQLGVTYLVAEESHVLKVGKLSPMEDGHYVQADDPTVAFVVGKDLFEALDRDPRHYHDKEVHGGGLYLSSTKWIEVTLRDDAGGSGVTRRFEKEGKRFWQVKPTRGWASEPALRALLNGFEQLEAKRYEAPADSDPAAYGLDRPKLTLIVHKRTMVETEGEADRFEDRSFAFKLGAPCEGHDGERYLQATGGPILCVAEAELQAAIDALGQPREARLLPMSAESVDRIEVSEGGQHLVVERGGKGETDGSADEQGYRYRLMRGDQVLKEGAAETESVRAWLSFLSAAKAETFDQGAASGPVRAGQVSVTIAAGEGETPLALTVYEGTAQGVGTVLVRRGDEPQFIAYPRSILTPLRASAAPFRQRKLIDRPPTELVEVSVEGPPVTAITTGGARAPAVKETLVRGKDGRFQITAPANLDADSLLTQDLARLLSALEANQFISDAPAPEHGLADGAAMTAIHFGFVAADEQEGQAARAAVTHQLTIGAEAPGLQGHYAQLGTEPAVFVVSQQLVDLVSQPLVSRVALSLPLEDLQRLDIAGPAGTCSVRASASPGSFAFENETASPEARAIAEALATLRAEAVTPYGAMAPPMRPTPDASARLSVTDRSGATQSITLSLAGEGRGIAHRDGDTVSFKLSEQALTTLTTCPTAAAPAP